MPSAGARDHGVVRHRRPEVFRKEGALTMPFNNLSNIHRGAIALLFGLSAGAFCLAPSAAVGEEKLIGSDEYAYSCLSCHGADGRGDGPMAEFLTVKPSDLTTIAKDNGGVFPVLEMFQIIDGRSVVGAHGLRGSGTIVGAQAAREPGASEMPVWGARFKAELDGKYGPYGGEQAVRARILELVFYLEAIQQR